MKNPGRIFWLIPVAAVLLAATVFMLPAFNLKEIEVQTEISGEAESIAMSSGLVQGSNMFITLLKEGNIFKMRFVGAEKRIEEKYEFLGDIRVTAVLPSKILITHKTREPVFEISYGGKYLVTDIKGCVLGSRDEHELGFIRITGLEIEEFSLGCIVFSGEESFSGLADIYSEMKTYDTRFLTAFREYIEWIDVSSTDMIAMLYDQRILVKMDSDGDLSHQTANMCTILSTEIGGNESGTLDFTVGENAVFSPDLS